MKWTHSSPEPGSPMILLSARSKINCVPSLSCTNLRKDFQHFYPNSFSPQVSYFLSFFLSFAPTQILQRTTWSYKYSSVIQLISDDPCGNKQARFETWKWSIVGVSLHFPKWSPHWHEQLNLSWGSGFWQSGPVTGTDLLSIIIAHCSIINLEATVVQFLPARLTSLS